MDKNLITYRLFESFPELTAFTTVKGAIQNVKKPRFTGIHNELSFASQKALAEILKIEISRLRFPKQEHTASIIEVSGTDFCSEEAADALITNKQGICLCIQTADCVPILFFDPVRKVIAAAHAGWRGTVKRIVNNVLEQFSSRYGSAPEDILVTLGPAISKNVYEVGKEVAEVVRVNIPNAEKAIDEIKNGKNHIDLHEANKQLMLAWNIPPENIEKTGYCTFTHSHLFFSARREGIDTGRLVTGIMLNA